MFRALGKAIAFTIGLLLMVISTIVGWTVNLNIISLSVFGIVLATRSCLQIFFAGKNNRHWNRIIRLILLTAAEKYVTTSDRKRLLKRFRGGRGDYEDWRSRLWQEYPEIKRYWKRIILRALNTVANGRPLPSVGIEVPIHGLDMEKEVMPTLASLVDQSYPNIKHVILGFNDPQNEILRRALNSYVTMSRDQRISMIDMPEGHKRGAMAEAYRLLIKYGVRLILNVDGDTTLDHDALSLAVIVMLVDPKVRGITSNVKVNNAYDNFLTRITSQRYNYANEIERGAQSYFYGVTCMSGPYMLCYAEDIEEMLAHPEEWEHQMFFGERVGPGDDRRQTQLLLKRRKGVVYIAAVITYTECPNEIRRFNSQQLRWIRSAMRGFLTQVTHISWFWRFYPWWSIADEIYLALFSFILAGVISSITLKSIIFGIQGGFWVGLSYALPYLIIVSLANGFKTAHLMIHNRDWGYWRIFFYQYYQLRYLTWLKFRAVFSLTNSKWLSRTQGGTMI